MLSFTRKGARASAGELAAYTIGLGGYVSGAASQTDDAVTSIRGAAGALPGVVILAATAVMLTYPLTEKAFRGMVAAEHRATAGLDDATATARPDTTP